MVTFDDLCKDLALGELSQHAFGKSGEIPEKSRPVILHYLNAGLTALYSEFPLSLKEVLIQQQDDRVEYPLLRKHAQTNTESIEPDKFIVDSVAQPFTEDIIRVDAVYDEAGTMVPVNDEYSPNSVFTTKWNTIQIPFPVSTNTTAVVYLAKHPTVTEEASEIDLPPVLMPALHAYIAAKCFVSLGQQSSAQLSVFFMNTYNEIVALVKRENLLQTTDVDSNLKLVAKGFI